MGLIKDFISMLIQVILELFQTLSSWATSSVEEVASTGPGIRFFQLYVRTVCKEFSRIIKNNILIYHQLFTSSFVSNIWSLRISSESILLLIQVYKDRNVVAQLVRRAEKAGFKAIALTVDTPRLGRREADIKNRCVWIY